MEVVWKNIDSDGALVRSQYASQMGKPYSALIKLGENQFLAYSPGVSQAASARALVPENAQLLLLAPARAHSMGLLEWKETFPKAEIFASEMAKSRLQKSTGIEEISSADKLQSQLPQAANIHIPPGSNLGEVWLSIEADDKEYWFVCDAFTNLQTLGNNIIQTMFLKFWGLRKGLVCHKVFAREMEDRVKFREWSLAVLEGEKPKTIIPCHGEIYDRADCRERLREIINEDFS